MASIVDIHVLVEDELTLALSVAVMVIVIFLILKKWASGPHSTDESLKNAIWEQVRFRSVSYWLKAILEDYAAINEEVARRDNLTLITGSILITSSFILLGGAATTEEPPTLTLAIASLGLYLVWLLLFHETAQKLNRLSFQRARAIEGVLTKQYGYSFGIHSYFTNKTSKGTAPWLRMGRRIFWYSVLLLLALSWMLLSLSISIS